MKIPTLRREELSRKDGAPGEVVPLDRTITSDIEAARSPHRTVSVSTDDQDISRF
jgi:hypothetical protein